MKRRSTAEKCAVIYADVTGQQTIIGDDDIISDFAIVADMRACHQEVFVADFSGAALSASAMDRAVFANDVLVADLNLRLPFR